MDTLGPVDTTSTAAAAAVQESTADSTSTGGGLRSLRKLVKPEAIYLCADYNLAKHATKEPGFAAGNIKHALFSLRADDLLSCPLSAVLDVLDAFHAALPAVYERLLEHCHAADISVRESAAGMDGARHATGILSRYHARFARKATTAAA